MPIHSRYATIVLEVNAMRSKPFLIEEIVKWHDVRIRVHTGSTQTVLLKVWRDVLRYGASGAAALGLDDIQFVPVKASSG